MTPSASLLRICCTGLSGVTMSVNSESKINAIPPSPTHDLEQLSCHCRHGSDHGSNIIFFNIISNTYIIYRSVQNGPYSRSYVTALTLWKMFKIEGSLQIFYLDTAYIDISRAGSFECCGCIIFICDRRPLPIDRGGKDGQDYAGIFYITHYRVADDDALFSQPVLSG